jgi:hypothetical protein
MAKHQSKSNKQVGNGQWNQALRVMFVVSVCGIWTNECNNAGKNGVAEEVGVKSLILSRYIWIICFIIFE